MASFDCIPNHQARMGAFGNQISSVGSTVIRYPSPYGDSVVVDTRVDRRRALNAIIRSSVTNGFNGTRGRTGVGHVEYLPRGSDGYAYNPYYWQYTEPFASGATRVGR